MSLPPRPFLAPVYRSTVSSDVVKYTHLLRQISTMFFQQWTGVNAILYYAPSIFQSLGLTGNTISLLATGVVGIA